MTLGGAQGMRRFGEQDGMGRWRARGRKRKKETLVTQRGAGWEGNKRKKEGEPKGKKG